MLLRCPHSIFVYLLVLLFVSTALRSQDTAKITLVRAGNLRYDKRLGENIQRLIGDVILKHENILLYCDSAYLNETGNSFDGFGNVLIKVGDTLDISGSVLHYEGNTRVAELHDRVKLVDRKATLTTNHLIYERSTGIAHYYNGGKIFDAKDTLVSETGHYFTHRKDAYFRHKVVLTNPEYTVNCDTLRYNTELKKSWFLGPTTITSEDTYIYCENGWYETGTGRCSFQENALITNHEQQLTGDSLFYDRRDGTGKGFRNVVLKDTVQNALFKGEKALLKRQEGYAWVTDRAQAIFIDAEDSLFLHADSLKITFDTAQQAKKMLGYYRTKFFRQDLQGLCDSLAYDFADSAFVMYRDPVLWSGENQLTADTIIITSRNRKIESMELMSSCFIISRDSTDSYNQMKGRRMTGHFRDNELYRIDVNGNSETVFFVREDDKSLIGINLAFAGDMQIFVENRKVQTITYIQQPKATLYPEKDLKKEDMYLRGFKWVSDRRPKTAGDIFTW